MHIPWRHALRTVVLCFHMKAATNLAKLSDRELKRLLSHSFSPRRGRGQGRRRGGKSCARWTKEEEDLLRTKPVEVVARLTGRTLEAVKGHKRAIGLGTPLRPWRAKDERLLGTRSDRAVARLLKRSLHNVAWRRRKLGIPCRYDHRPWLRSHLKLVGVKTDEEVARRTGHPLAAVKAKRQQLGLPKPDQ